MDLVNVVLTMGGDTLDQLDAWLTTVGLFVCVPLLSKRPVRPAQRPDRPAGPLALPATDGSARGRRRCDVVYVVLRHQDLGRHVRCSSASWPPMRPCPPPVRSQTGSPTASCSASWEVVSTAPAPHRAVRYLTAQGGRVRYRRIRLLATGRQCRHQWRSWNSAGDRQPLAPRSPTAPCRRRHITGYGRDRSNCLG